MITALTTALQLPEDGLPPRRKPSKGQRFELDPALPRLKKLRDLLATEVALEPGLVAPNALLESLSRARPETPEQMREVPGIRRWQAAILGERFLQELSKGV